MKKTIIKVAASTLIIALAVIGSLTAENKTASSYTYKLSDLLNRAEASDFESVQWVGSGAICFDSNGGCNTGWGSKKGPVLTGGLGGVLWP